MATQLLLPALLALQSTDEGLSGREIVQSLPRDPASIFALVLIIALAGLVLWYGRPKGGGDVPSKPA